MLGRMGAAARALDLITRWLSCLANSAAEKETTNMSFNATTGVHVPGRMGRLPGPWTSSSGGWRTESHFCPGLFVYVCI